MADGSQMTPTEALQQQALAYGGVGAYPAVQRSQILAEMLQRMAANPPALRSPTSLWSNLGAEVLMNLGRNRSNARLAQAAMQGMNQQAQVANAGAFGPPGGDAGPGVGVPAAGAPPGMGSAGAPAAAVPPAITAAAPPSAPAAQPHLGAGDFFTNFFAPHEGRWNPRDANGGTDAWGLNSVANPDIAGKGPLTQAQAEPIFAARYFNASGAPNMPPALAAMHADTFALNPGWASAALQQSGGDPAKYMAIRQGLMQQDLARNPAVRPYAGAWAARNRDLMTYAASVGGGGAQAQGGAPAAPPVPMGAPLQQAAQPIPQGPGGPPTGPYATPQEAAFIRQSESYPVGSIMWQQGLQKAQEVRDRAMTPMAPPKDMYWGPDGRAIPMPGTGYTNLQAPAPGVRSQADPFGKVSDSPVPNAVNNGQVWNPQSGSYQPLPGLQPQISGGFAPGSVVSQTPGSAPSVVQGPVFDPEKVRQSFLSSPEVAKYNEARSSTQGLFNALSAAAKAGGQNGITGSAALTTFLQTLSPGSAPRPTTVEQVVKNLGLPDELQSQIMKVTGNGYLTPQTLGQIGQTAVGYVNAYRQAAQQRMDSDTAAARSYNPKAAGVPGEMLAAPPAMPSIGVGGPAPAQQNPQQVLQEARQAILQGAPRAAVMGRLQAMGINPGAL